MEKDVVRLSAHRNNIERYRRLLKTILSDTERQFIERRLQEEAAAVDLLTLQKPFRRAGAEQFNA
ncbi:hypothetical protein HAP47_0030145 [Bradyrhizobium sp. 41S5]|uniref:hypothetical protein n=1 Tax=Bradyrhizobium sp. 41S5 TaxID=1404443 RepID=UPI00156B0631|nr:hypothetical protein [Bradyrhizobium sp. 41S5]UFX43452.1 hypothetical protein HAP47_0030145 [Bradyrhizobium sp. 41S5]